jgi:hypothetical protein
MGKLGCDAQLAASSKLCIASQLCVCSLSPSPSCGCLHLLLAAACASSAMPVGSARKMSIKIRMLTHELHVLHKNAYTCAACAYVRARGQTRDGLVRHARLRMDEIQG